MTVHRCVSGILFTALITLSGGCGAAAPDDAAGGAPARAAGAPADACALLTPADIRDVLGAEVGAPAYGPGSMPGGPISICQWPRSAGETIPFVQVSVTPNAATSYADWMAGMARDLGEPIDPAISRQVDGIGDWAVYDSESRTLLVGVGRRLLHVMVPPAAGQSDAEALARRAYERIR